MFRNTGKIPYNKKAMISQIGSTWMLTAAHCVFDEEELLPARSLTITLGVKGKWRREKGNRWFKDLFKPLPFVTGKRS